MEELITPILEVFVSVALQEIKVTVGATEQLEELKETLESLQHTLQAPEAETAQKWFERLRGVYYDAKEIVDDSEFYHLERQGSTRAKVRQFLPVSNNPCVFRYVMGRKIKRIRESLSSIKKDKDVCDIATKGGGKGVLLAEVTATVSDNFLSLCKSSDVIGRDKDAQNILEFLSKDSVTGPVRTIPIVGIGGIGKTALAFKVYSAEGIDAKFPLKLWALVKHDFNNWKNLLRKILASASKPPDHLDTEKLQKELKEILKGKAFLLVLDDVRSVNRVNWDKLSRLLSDGASGGRIVVTTRDQSVASVVSPNRPHDLQGLTDEDSLTLFEQWTFGRDEGNRETLMRIGKEIVEKCKGVVGAIMTVARLLQVKREQDQWLKVRENDFWRIFEKKGRFISYEELPSYLKPCFAYFSNLPKGFEILGIELIHQWIAQGFIQPSDKTQEPEKVGKEYIYELMTRSFLQNTDGHGLFSTIKMHDLVHELAISVAQTEYLIMDSHVKGVPPNVRHLLFSGKKILQKDEVAKMRKVRTVGFQFVGPDRCLLDTCISRFKCLRMLGLRNSSFKALPSSIGGLKYLRYLDLSGNRNIESLPHSICRLLLLETLMLQGCVKFVKLPKDVGKLPRLRCLRLTTRERFLSGKLIAGLRDLQCLWIEECDELEHLFDTKEIENRCILSIISVLVIKNCKILMSLPRRLSSLAKLENLMIVNCEKLDLTKIDKCDGGLANLRCLWVEKLPQLVDFPGWLLGGTNLEELRISECPELIRRCEKEKGEDHKISHVRVIYLNGTKVQG